VTLDAGGFVLANNKKRPMPAAQCVIMITKPNDDVFLVTLSPFLALPKSVSGSPISWA
jgi:hypothetical protein